MLWSMGSGAPASKGYTRLAFNLNELNADNRYTYLDRSVERGRTYCYRILGEFGRLLIIQPKEV